MTVFGWCVLGEEVTNLVGRQDFETAVEKQEEDEEKEGEQGEVEREKQMKERKIRERECEKEGRRK